MLSISFAAVALCATQVFADHFGVHHGHHGSEVEEFGFKGAFRGKGAVWKYGDKYDKYDLKDYGKYSDTYHDKYPKSEDKYDDKLDWGKGLDVYHPDRYHWSHRYCQKVCEATPGCRHDPQAHGSYCKFRGTHDGRPAICFGLYRIPKSLCHPHEHGIYSRKYCFEPFSKHCNDARLQPVRCDREPTFDRWGAVISLEIFLEGDDRRYH
jgi:hypothetical protein